MFLLQLAFLLAYLFAAAGAVLYASSETIHRVTITVDGAATITDVYTVMQFAGTLQGSTCMLLCKCKHFSSDDEFSTPVVVLRSVQDHLNAFFLFKCHSVKFICACICAHVHKCCLYTYVHVHSSSVHTYV